MKPRKLNLIISAAVILFSLLAIIVSDSSSKFASPFKEPSSGSLQEEGQEQTIIDRQVRGTSDSDSPSLQEDSADDQGAQESNEEIEQQIEGYKVVKVVDGDTLDVEIDGKIERLRLIGIDTPETVDPRKSVQCFGIEASNKAKELLNGKFVALESDETQGDRDKYKRLLRYVFLPDGTNFNLYMIAQGYANEYTYDEPYKYQAEFKQAEIDARNQEKGLWNSKVCPQ